LEKHGEFRYIRDDILSYNLEDGNVTIKIAGKSLIVLDLMTWTEMIKKMYAVLRKGMKPYCFRLDLFFYSP
jgi:hypothetical protein